MSADSALHWHAEPATLLPLAVFTMAYGVGIARLWSRAGLGRGLGFRHVSAGAAALLFVLVALCSPLASLSERLFSAHMAVHEILMGIAAPLLIIARPWAAIAWLLPVAISRSLRPLNAVAGPLAATLLQAAVIWAWHVPAFFRAALQSQTLHVAQHMSFFGSALLYWHAMDRLSKRRAGTAVGYHFATALHTGFLGALLMLPPRLWFPAAGGYGLSPLEDQQLGGAIMWMPGGLVYAAAALLAAGQWIARDANGKPGVGAVLRGDGQRGAFTRRRLC